MDLDVTFQKLYITFNMEYINHVPFYDSNKPHRHDYYQIIVLEKGTMKTKSNKIPAY
jgi:hypothetical protein